MTSSMKYSILLIIASVVGTVVSAQDSTRGKEVNVTSQFKPTLKDAAKINFNPSPPAADSSRPRLQYSIPNQNLALGFQPGSLKPLALEVDSGGTWGNESYVKLGYGNLKNPLFQAGVSFGDGKNVGLNIYAKHNSAKGNIPYQDYTNSQVDANAFFKSAKNLEWNVRFGGQKETYNKYGFLPRTLVFPEDSINVKYQTWRGRINFHNINRTDLGLSYSPEIKIEAFNDQLGNSESNTYLNVPLQKSLGSSVEVDVAATANLSRYTADNKTGIANNYLYFSPGVVFKKENLDVTAGIRPSWDNGLFRLLPNFLVEFKTANYPFSFQVGWTAYLRNSGFQYQASLNPWIFAPATVNNTKVEERYLGLKGSVGDHFNYSAKASLNIMDNQPLFVNDTASGKSFRTLNESELKMYSIGGEMGYTVGEKFSLISNLSLNGFHLKDNAKAWGLLPLEWKTTMRAEILKDLYLNTGLYIFDGPWSLTKQGKTNNLPMASDLSAGLEFKIYKNIKLWMQFNNIFNKEYERWNQYPVYGFNFLGGVVFSFAQKSQSVNISH
ncbi:MAG: hypothetical protein ACXVBX_07520 [Flavisolibacter sp.]